MKKILTYVVIVLAGVYCVGYYNLGTGGVIRFLDKMHAMTIAGDSQGLCDLLTDDMKVAITDHTVEVDRRLGDGKTNGGKTELCKLFNEAGTAFANGTISLQSHRQDLLVKRETLLHPLTAEVTYNEKQAATIQAGGRSITIKTESDDKLLLVTTISGVKIKRMESESWLQ
jgi:hypothetical protein